MFFGEQEYEVMGPGQSCGTCSFIDDVLRDSDGDTIDIKNIIVEVNDGCVCAKHTVCTTHPLN